MREWKIVAWALAFVPDLPELGARERIRACTGVLLGILTTAGVCLLLTPFQHSQIWLIAPMGATAIILFTLPASPLAQPWSVLGGNLVSALAGITCLHLISNPLVCVCTAAVLALALMFALRCLHPPSGAVALITILGGDSVKDLGYTFILNPLGLNTLILILCAILYNKATGQQYPHTKHRTSKTEINKSNNEKVGSLGVTHQDLSQALREYNQFIDIDLGDLEQLFLNVERLSLKRRTATLSCEQTMSTQVDTLTFATELSQAWEIIKQRNTQALPVLTPGGHLLGIVTRSDFLREVGMDAYPTFTSRLKTFLEKNTKSTSTKAEVVGQIMRKDCTTVLADKPVLDIVPIMLAQKVRHIAVVDNGGVYLGMINQSDLIAALYQIALSSTLQAKS